MKKVLMLISFIFCSVFIYAGGSSESSTPEPEVPETETEVVEEKEPETLHDMVISNDTLSIQKMFNLDVDMNERDEDGKTPLHLAIEQNRKDIAEILIKQGSDINMKDNNGNTCLHLAVLNDSSPEIFSLLSHYKADYFITNNEGLNSLQLIIRNWEFNEEKLNFLFDETNLNSKDSMDNNMIHYTVKGGSYVYTDYFIRNKTSINLKNSEGKIPLDIALSYPDSKNHALCTELLIKGGSRLPEEKSFHYLFQVVLTDNAETRYDLDSTALHIAASRGHLGVAEVLLDKKLSIDIRDKSGSTALHEAIRGNQYEMVQFLVNKGADVNASDFRKNTSLHIALGDVINARIISFLLIHGANPNQRNDFGNAPLHIIISRSIRTEIARTLLHNGADIDGRNRLGNTPLMECVVKNNRNLGMLFLQNGADIFADNNKSESPLEYAISKGASHIEWFLYDSNINDRDNLGNSPLITALQKNADSELFQTILNKGSLINVRNKNGDSPLHIAIRNDRIDLADMLLKRQADLFSLNNKGESPLLIAYNKGVDYTGKLLVSYVDESDKHGETPLSYASFWGYERICSLLLTLGANPDKGNINGDTPLHKVVQNQNDAIATLLLNAGANPDVKNKSGNTPLHDVVYWDSRSIADILIAKGADINAENTDGKTVLHESVLNNNFQMCRYMMDKGAYVNSRDNTGTTPLHYAVSKNFLNITKLLIDEGADLLTRDKWGNTLLHDGVVKQNREISMMLLDSGADIFAQNKTGQTPLDNALEMNYKEIEWFFIKKVVQSRDNKGNTVLHIALLNNSDKLIISKILDEGGDPKARNSDNITCLDLAVSLERDDVIPYMKDSD